MIAVVTVALVGSLAITLPAYATSDGCTGNPGSNGSKCIYVVGTKLHVDTVKTTLTKNHADDCGYATISIGPSWKTTSGRICRARDFTWGPIPVNQSFKNGTKACASWSNYPEGQACVTIHD